ncbi:hypothetical protein [Deinococcus sp. UYEF24]
MPDTRSQFIQRALEKLATKLPEEVELTWQDLSNPEMLSITAQAPHAQPDRQYKAAVHVLAVAEANDGLGPTLAEVLRVLRQRGSAHSLPVARLDEPAPVIAVRTLVGLEQQDPPLRFVPKT